MNVLIGSLAVRTTLIVNLLLAHYSVKARLFAADRTSSSSERSTAKLCNRLRLRPFHLA
jgi:hypothetical protein